MSAESSKAAARDYEPADFAALSYLPAAYWPEGWDRFRIEQWIAWCDAGTSPLDVRLRVGSCNQASEWTLSVNSSGNVAQVGRAERVATVTSISAVADSRDPVEGSSPTSRAEPMFIDLDTIDSTAQVAATIGLRVDGLALIYPSATNGLIGDPEQGKSLVAAVLAIEVLRAAGTVTWIDLDHNGAMAFKSRVRSLGWSGGFARLRFAQPEDQDGVMAIVNWSIDNTVDLFIVDSVGELLPIFGASSDSADDFSRVNRQVMAAVALAGAAVLTIDHFAKGTDSRAFGASGTIAKKRAVDGALYKVTAIRQFAPGQGGTASLKLLKDRHGSVRAGLASQNREPEAAVFEVLPDGSWSFHDGIQRIDPIDALVAVVAAMNPTPTSQNEIRKALNIGAVKAKEVWDRWNS